MGGEEASAVTRGWLNAKNPTLSFELTSSSYNFDPTELSRNQWSIQEVQLGPNPDDSNTDLNEKPPLCGTRDLGGHSVIEWFKRGSIARHRVENGIDYFVLDVNDSTGAGNGLAVESAEIRLDSSNSWTLVYANVLTASGIRSETEVTYATTPTKGIRWPVSATWKTGNQSRAYELNFDFDARAKPEDFELTTYGFPAPQVPSLWSRYWLYAAICVGTLVAWLVYWFRK